MLDRERILAKIDELESYLHDLRTIAPESFTVYQQIEKKRACERLLQQETSANAPPAQKRLC